MDLSAFQLKGIVFITGGASGIGYATAEAAAKAGAEVVIAGRNESKLATAEKELRKKGYNVHYHQLDVTDSKAVDEAVRHVEQTHGPVNMLVANAGVSGVGIPAEEVSDEDFDKIVKTNLYGAFYCCRAFGAAMLRRGEPGSIVVVGSISGAICNYTQTSSAYNTSKAGVAKLVGELAVEWGKRGIRVNNVAPAYIRTPMTEFGIIHDPELAAKWIENTPIGRIGEPREIAEPIVFLLSRASSYITATTLFIDGGYTAI